MMLSSNSPRPSRALEEQEETMDGVFDIVKITFARMTCAVWFRVIQLPSNRVALGFGSAIFKG